MIELGQLELENIGPLAKVSIPLRKQGLVLLRGENRDTTAATSNGVGKSWVLKGLSWVLFGDTVDDERTDDVMRRGATMTWGSVEIHDSATTRKVFRSRTKSGTKLEMTEDGEVVSGITIKDTQEKINKLLGMDFQTFRNTVMFGQGDTDRFADFKTPDATRKDILKRVLRVDVLDRAAKHASNKAKLAQARWSEAERKKVIAETRLEGLSTEAVDEDIASLKEQSEGVKKQSGRLGKLRDYEKQVTEVLEAYAKKQEEVETLKQKRQAEINKANAADAQKRVEDYKAREADKAPLQFKAGKCPVCTTPATGKHVQAHLTEKKQEADAARKEIKRLEGEAKSARERAASHASAIEKLQGEVADAGEWEARQRTLQDDIKAAESAEATLKKLSESIKAKEASRDAMSGAIETAQAEVQAQTEEMEAALEEKALAEFWVRGFGNKGLVSHVIEQVTPQLQSQANYWLSILTDGDITMEMDSVSKLKTSGEERDKFSITLDIEGTKGVRPSGGQGNKVKIASSLGLADVVAAREHAALDFAGLDEVLDGLDASGKARVSDLLMELRKRRSTILVVSHDPSLVEMFEKVVTLVKEGGVTTQVTS